MMASERKLRDGYVASAGRFSKEEWERTVAGFSDLTIYQTWAYGAVRWGEANLMHFVLMRAGQVVAAAQARVVRASLLRLGVAYVRYGPLWCRKGEEENLEVFRQAVRAMHNEFVRKRRLVLRLNLNLTALDEPQRYLDILRQEGYGRTRFALPQRTLLVDLTPSLEDLRSGLHQTWRNQLNQAEKRFGVTVTSGTSQEYFQQFVAVHDAMLAAKRFAVFAPAEEFMAMQDLLPEDQKQLIVLGQVNGRTVAGGVISVTGSKAIELLAASDAEGRETRAGYAVQWRTLQLLKERGCRWYDLNGIDPVTNPGGYRFKIRLGGRHGVDTTYIGQFQASPDVLRAAVAELAQVMLTSYRRAKMILGGLRARRGFRRRTRSEEQGADAAMQNRLPTMEVKA